MHFTIHKCVCKVMTVPNPTQYTKIDKYVVVNNELELGPEVVRKADVAFMFSLFCCSADYTTLATGVNNR